MNKLSLFPPLLVFYYFIGTAASAKILVVCPFFGKSHSAFIHPIVNGLAEKKHEVTMIATNLIENPPETLRQIQVEAKTGGMEAMPSEKFFELDKIPTPVKLWFFWNALLGDIVEDLKSETMRKFIEEDETEYDLVMIELFFHEVYYAFAHKYKAPIVLLGTGTHFSVANTIMGNPSTISYIGHEFSKKNGELGVLERVNNFLIAKYENLIYRYWYVPKQEALMNQYFGKLEKPLPSVEDLEKNITLVLANTHFTIDTTRALVPGIVEVGGVHLKPYVNMLSRPISRFLETRHGFVYFSFGSHFRIASMPKDKFDAIIRVLSKLKQNVLMKWEDEEIPTLPENIMTRKWFSQSDIFAHPNLKVFITQGGMLSYQEAVYKGVPMLGLSLGGDQHLNMAKMAETGMGVHLPLDELTEENFLSAITGFVNSTKYKERAIDVSRRFNDRPVSPLDTAIYWIEYVMKHKNVKLKSPLADLPWYKENMLDVYAVLLVTLVIKIFVTKMIIKFIFGICIKKNVSGVKSKNE